MSASWGGLPTSDQHESTRQLVLDALRKPGPFWFENLGPLLILPRWSELGERYGIDRENYGTARILGQTPQADRTVIGSLCKPVFDDDRKILVESLGPQFVDQYSELGLKFYRSDEVGPELLSSLRCAIHLISLVRGAAVSVSAVLSVLHLLKPNSPNYDVSFSEPFVPFSIFVGVEREGRPNDDLRLAEGILHECMHLQLTLIEGQIALIAAEKETHFSPWRQEIRPTRGVLHALYVFRAIQDFFAALMASATLSEGQYRYAQRRYDQIDEDVLQVEDLTMSQDLTPIGRAFATRLKARK
ncbi:aKG-HExxH-type peptide beta-hydroxylase [Bradyrhizobium sp. AZCC 2289]|uniref:aKG-HExxH-type peptide beta-hydroxylase n=1 Tax=Bradyrhizobium sp. AZCC 2289 TaxID=3117026 RepID=UPI002FEEE008